MSEGKRFSLVRPTPETPFSIDFDWWKQHDNNWRIFLHGYLCQEHQAVFAGAQEDTKVDWVDPDTAEVHMVEGLQHVLMTHCARQPEFLSMNSMLVDSVFRLLLANGNEPMTANELSKAINRPANTILQTLSSGSQVYKGIRPRHG